MSNRFNQGKSIVETETALRQTQLYRLSGVIFVMVAKSAVCYSCSYIKAVGNHETILRAIHSPWKQILVLWQAFFETEEWARRISWDSKNIEILSKLSGACMVSPHACHAIAALARKHCNEQDIKRLIIAMWTDSKNTTSNLQEQTQFSNSVPQHFLKMCLLNFSVILFVSLDTLPLLKGI